MTISLFRIMLFVQDVDLLKGFYVEHFQMQVLEETAGAWLVLKAGNCELALHKIGSNVDPNQKYMSNAKLVFEVSNLDALRSELLADKTAIGETRRFESNPNLFCDGTDPEGNVFQLMQRA